MDPHHQFERGEEIFRWGPIPGRAFYQGEVVLSIYVDVPKRYPGFAWPKTLMLYQPSGQMVWLNEFPLVRAFGRDLFLKYMLPDDVREGMYREWIASVARLNEFEEALRPELLAACTEEELTVTMGGFLRHILDFWAPTFIQEGANYGSDQYLDELLKPFVPDAARRGEVMGILTAPEQPSFFQQEEIELAETDDISAHRAAYFWLHNSYAGTEILTESYFRDRKSRVPSSVRAATEEHIRSVREMKEEAQGTLGLSEEIMRVAHALVRGIEWQDERKRQIFILQHYKDICRTEMARRFSVDPSRILQWGFHELVEMLETRSFESGLPERPGCFGYVCNVEDIEIVTGEEARALWDLYAHEKPTHGSAEIRGVVASRGTGKAFGKVRIVRDPKETGRFEEGDVLVTPMTSPDFVFLMKRSCAIVTDSGGLTSHAAVVSRELKKPCIIGTKIATQVLKDGDMVEVDAERGVVRKIS